MRFEFSTTNRIIFGKGTICEVAPIASQQAHSAFVITGRNPQRSLPLFEQLDKEGVKHTTFSVHEEPTVEVVEEGIEYARRAACGLVISIGGGSVIDAGKVVAAMLTNSGRLNDYLEVVGQGKPLMLQAAKHIAIPTTAGTGAEVTRNSVLTVPEHRVKVSVRNSVLLPWLAVVDPELTYSIPPDITAGTGLDAITQLIEAFVSNKANPMTDSFCREGLKRAAMSLKTACADGNDCAARENMSLASLLGGLSLANAGLGTVHGFSGVLGGMFAAPHGIICGRLLPFIMKANIKALKSRTDGLNYVTRYDEVARILTCNPNARAEDGVDWVHELCRTLDVPSLSKFGLTQDDFSTVVQNVQHSSSIKGNPVILTNKELMEILEKAV
jgi:alcohol dehydrogenase class IV